LLGDVLVAVAVMVYFCAQSIIKTTRKLTTIELKSKKSSLRVAQLNKSSSTALSHSSYYSWNRSSKFDTLVNQQGHAAPIRSPICGRMDFFQNRGVCRQISLAPHTIACFVKCFALTPVCTQQESFFILITCYLTKNKEKIIENLELATHFYWQIML